MWQSCCSSRVVGEKRTPVMVRAAGRGVGVQVGVAVRVAVALAVLVCVGVRLGPVVAVRVGVLAGVIVELGVRVAVGVGVLVRVAALTTLTSALMLALQAEKLEMLTPLAWPLYSRELGLDESLNAMLLLLPG